MSIPAPRDAFSKSAPLDSRPARPWPGLVLIALAAILLLFPELVIGMTVTDNYRFNLLWPEQFGALVRGGHAYPRWLPHAWEGLGSPVFYFYPPLFFWVTGLVDVVTAGTLQSERFVPLGSLIVLVAGGFAMRAWLRVHAGERRALVGAIAYMAAPYHLYDIYARGALAEATSYASVPLIMLALARLGQGKTRYLPLLALGYAALLLSHLPTALLVSVLLIPAYVGWTAIGTRRPARFLVQALAGGGVGIGLATIYLLPALTLLSFVNPQSLTRAFYRPETWFFWNFPAGSMGARMAFIIPVSVGAAMLSAGTWMAAQGPQARREAAFWALLTAVAVALLAGLVPPFWKLPGMALVQFPSRALMLVEFMTVTVVAITVTAPRNPLVLGGIGLLAFAYVALVLMALHTVGRTVDGQTLTASQIRASYLDAPEYLPTGVRIREGAGPDDVEVDLARVPLARASNPRARVNVSAFDDGEMTVTVASPVPTRIAVRRYYFPSWEVRDPAGRPVPVSPEPGNRVVTFPAMAGRNVYRLEHGVAPNEMLARTISLVALALLVISAAVTWRTSAER